MMHWQRKDAALKLSCHRICVPVDETMAAGPPRRGVDAELLESKNDFIPAVDENRTSKRADAVRQVGE